MEPPALYGFKGGDMEDARLAIESALNIRMVPHNSLYIGNYYLFESEAGEILQLQENIEPLDEEILESDFPEFSVLLYLMRRKRPGELEQVLTAMVPSLRLLRREIG